MINTNHFNRRLNSNSKNIIKYIFTLNAKINNYLTKINIHFNKNINQILLSHLNK
jgi:hypothetical protein